MGFSMYIPQKHRYCTDTQKEQKNLWLYPSGNKWDFSWNLFLLEPHNISSKLFWAPDLLLAPNSEGRSRSYNLALQTQLLSWFHWRLQEHWWKSFQGKPEDSEIKMYPWIFITALWQRQQATDKIFTGCCTAQKTLPFIARPDFEEPLAACHGRRYFISQTVFVQKRCVETTKCLLETFYSCTQFCLIPGRCCWVASTHSSLPWSSICSFSAESWKRSIRNKASLFLRENVRGNKRLIWA